MLFLDPTHWRHPHTQQLCMEWIEGLRLINKVNEDNQTATFFRLVQLDEAMMYIYEHTTLIGATCCLYWYGYWLLNSNINRETEEKGTSIQYFLIVNILHLDWFVCVGVTSIMSLLWDVRMDGDKFNFIFALYKT